MILSEIPYDKLHEKLLGTALDSIGMHISSVNNLKLRLKTDYRFFVFQVHTANGSKTIHRIFRMRFECWLWA